MSPSQDRRLPVLFMTEANLLRISMRVVLIATWKLNFSNVRIDIRTYRRIVSHCDDKTAKFLLLPWRDCVAKDFPALSRYVTDRTRFIQGAERIIVNPLIDVSINLVLYWTLHHNKKILNCRSRYKLFYQWVVILYLSVRLRFAQGTDFISVDAIIS